MLNVGDRPRDQIIDIDSIVRFCICRGSTWIEPLDSPTYKLLNLVAESTEALLLPSCNVAINESAESAPCIGSLLRVPIGVPDNIKHLLRRHIVLEEFVEPSERKVLVLQTLKLASASKHIAGLR